MKIQVIGNAFFNYDSAIVNAFENYHHEVKLTIMKPYPAGIRSRIFGHVYKWKHREYGNELLYLSPYYWQKRESDIVMREFNSFKPDLVVAFPGYNLTDEVIRKMNGCMKVIWVYDGVKNIPRIVQKIRLFAHAFVFEQSDVDYLGAKGITASFLPMGADKEVFYDKDLKKDIDISFVGKISLDRYKVLKTICDAFPNLKIVIYGKYSIKIRLMQVLFRRAELRKFMYRNASPTEANNLYNRSKICLNIHKEQSKNGANPRFYEILAAKGFQITNSNEYIEKNFTDEVVIYHSNPELIGKIKHYLANAEERDIIRGKGHFRVIDNHMFENRVEEILKFLEDSTSCRKYDGD